MKKLILITLLLMSVANADVFKVKYEQTAYNVFLVESEKEGKLLIKTDGCFCLARPGEHYEGYVSQEPNPFGGYNYQLMAQDNTCDVVSIQRVK